MLGSNLQSLSQSYKIKINFLLHNVHPESKVHGANMGPIWGRQDPRGPDVGQQQCKAQRYALTCVCFLYCEIYFIKITLFVYKYMMKYNGITVVLLPTIDIMMGIHDVRSNTQWTKMVYSLTTLSVMAI